MGRVIYFSLESVPRPMPSLSCDVRDCEGCLFVCPPLVTPKQRGMETSRQIGSFLNSLMRTEETKRILARVVVR